MVKLLLLYTLRAHCFPPAPQQAWQCPCGKAFLLALRGGDKCQSLNIFIRCVYKIEWQMKTKLKTIILIIIMIIRQQQLEGRYENSRLSDLWHTHKKRKTRWSLLANQHLEPVVAGKGQDTGLVPHTLKPHGPAKCYWEVRLTMTGYSKDELWHHPMMIVMSFCTIQGLNKNNGWTCRSYSSSQEISTNIFFLQNAPL